MAKKKNTSIWKCDSCGHTSSKYFGLCSECKNGYGEEEEINNVVKDSKGNLLNLQEIDLSQAKKVVSIKDIDMDDIERIDTGFSQLNQVFGGKGNNTGLMPQSLNVIYGRPGVGKSTLLLQLLDNLSKKHRCAYISGEETPEQLKERYLRLELTGDFDLTSENNVLHLQELMKPYDILIIDSINTMIKPNAGIIGGDAQLKENALFFMDYAKDSNKTIILIAQVTKEDKIAGTNFFKHMVDALFVYSDLDDSKKYKSIIGEKNRFGKTTDTSILEMHEKGLSEIQDPSFIFTNSDDDNEDIYGSALSMMMQGQRPVFVEIDSLVNETQAEQSFFSAVGIERNKYSQLLAIINKYLNMKTYGVNVYSSITGGLRLFGEPQIDLAVIASILSSHNTKNIKKYIFVGEVSLNGSIKKHQREKDFIDHIKTMGIKKEVVCHSNGYTHIRDILKIFN